DSDLFEKLIGLRNYGQRVRYHHDTVGFNSRLDGLQAAFLSVKLPHLEGWNRSRQAHAQQYQKDLKGLPLTLLAPETPAGQDHIYHLFVVRTDQRDALREHLAADGIETGIH